MCGWPEIVSKLSGVHNLAAYVFTIARNEANRLARRRKREPAGKPGVAADLLFDEAWSDDVSQRETAELVARALGDLPVNEREVVELKTYAGLTFREIAEVTGSPPGTVATRYRTGLETDAEEADEGSTMKDDVERMLNSLTPQGAAAGLRDEVLEAVAGELAATVRLPRRGSRWDLRIGATVAVALILGVALNVWAIRSDDARQARLFGPSPLPREICETVETVEQVAGTRMRGTG